MIFLSGNAVFLGTCADLRQDVGMSTLFALRAWVQVGLVGAFLGGASAHAAPSNEDEASMGAAAIIVLAQKCDSGRISYYQAEATKTLQYMLQRYSQEAKERIFDGLNMKIKALHMSSSADSCAGASRLHAMATQWGYDHLIKSLPSQGVALR